MNRELKKYCKEVRSWLPCSGRVKKQILSQITETLSAYEQEHPEAGIADIEQRFGTPQQIAGAYLDEISTPDLVQKLNIQRRIVKTLTIGIGIVIAMWIVFLIASFIDVSSATQGYIVIFD